MAQRSKSRSKGRRSVSSQRILALLSDRRILLGIIAAILVIVILAVSLSNRAKRREQEEAMADLQTSVSRLESENGRLQAALQEQAQLAESYQQDLSDTVRAMDLFWQIDEAYVLSRHSRCRELIQILESESMAGALPTTSTTNNGRFSPYDRYAEICEALGEPYGNGVKQ